MARALERAYLIVGSDELKRDAAVRRLRGRLDEALAAFNLDELYASSEIDPSMLITSLNTLPIGDTFRLVLVHDADRLSKASSEALVSYLENPNPAAVLALVSDKLSRSTRLYKAVARAGERTVVDCSPKKRWELPAQVSKMASTHGVSMGSAAATELINRVGERTTLLDAQLAVLAEFCREQGNITVEDVRKHVARVAEVRPWELLDAACERNVSRTLELYGLIPHPSHVALLALLVSRIRELICARSLEARGQAWALADELGKQAWQVKHHLRWSQSFATNELEHLLTRCADCDAQLKAGANPDSIFVQLLLEVCGSTSSIG